MCAFPERDSSNATFPNRAEPTPALNTAPFSVVVPAFDEEEGMIATLDSLRFVLSKCGRAYEIVVVDDGSTDATPRILVGYSDITLIRHADNRGYGAALKAGIAAARYPLIVVIDGDGTYPAAAIPGLVDECARADMVVGARTGPNVHSAPARSVAKWCFRQYAQWITGTAIPDLNSGLRAFHRPVAERFSTLLPDGFSFTTTITIASILEGYVVRFESVDYLQRIGRSKLRPVPDTLRILRQLIRLGLRFAPFRTSVAFALPLLGAGAASVLIRSGDAYQRGVGSAGWLVTGIAILFAGVALEQQVRRRRTRDAESL